MTGYIGRPAHNPCWISRRACLPHRRHRRPTPRTHLERRKWPGGTFGTGAPSTVQIATVPNPVDFLNVAHSLWALLIACGGGWFAVGARKGRKPE